MLHPILRQTAVSPSTMKPEETTRTQRNTAARWLRILDHLSFRVKFLALGLCLAAPLLVVATWAAASAYHHARESRDRELAIQTLQQVSTLLALVADHRGLTARILAGAEGLSGELVLKQQRFRAQARHVDGALEAVQPNNEPSTRGTLRDEVEALIQLPHSDAPERNFERHNEMADRLLAVSRRVELRMLAGTYGEGPGIAQVYAAVFSLLPQLSERVARQRGWGSWVLTLQTYTPEELNRYGMYVGHARQTLRELMADQATLLALESQMQAGAGRSTLREALDQADIFVERSLASVLSFTRDDNAAEQHFSEGSTALAGLAQASGLLTQRLLEHARQLQEQAAQKSAWAMLSLAGVLAASRSLAQERGTAGSAPDRSRAKRLSGPLEP